MSLEPTDKCRSRHVWASKGNNIVDNSRHCRKSVFWDTLPDMANRSLPLMLHATRVSPCHKTKCLIVRSRNGGMVSRNCLECGKPHYITLSDFPKVICPLCETEPLSVRKADGTNYCFVCDKCDVSTTVAEVVPGWSDQFRYHGLAAFGDNMPNG
jgi:hypothetical protein